MLRKEKKETDLGKAVEVNTKNMTCVHTYPCIMKLKLLLLDHLAEDLCYELGSKLAQKKMSIAAKTKWSTLHRLYEF